MNKVCISADDVRVSLVSLGLNVWHHVPVVKGVSRKEVAGSFLHCEYLLAFVLPSFHVTTFIMSVILPVGNKTIHLRKKIKNYLKERHDVARISLKSLMFAKDIIFLRKYVFIFQPFLST